VNTEWRAFFVHHGIWPVYTVDLNENPVPIDPKALDFNEVILS